MRSLRSILLTTFSAAVLVAVLPTQPANAQSPATLPNDHLADELAAAFSQVITQRSIDPLASAIDPSFVGVMPTGETVHGFVGLKKYWDAINEQLGKDGECRAQVRPGPTQIVGDIALLHGDTDLILVYATGQQVRGTVAWTAVLHHVGEHWLVMQAQGSVNPIDNQFGRTNFHTVMIIWSGLALFVGIGIGIAAWKFWTTREPGSVASR
jgi:hypothetical protein